MTVAAGLAICASGARAQIGLNSFHYDTLQGDSYLIPISNGLAQPTSGTSTYTDTMDYGDLRVFDGITANNNMMLIFTGLFDTSVDGPGQYSFGTESDDGSMLYIDINGNGDFGDPEDMIVDNRGGHGMQFRVGTVNLTERFYNIAIGFYQGGGGHGLRVRFAPGNVTWNSMNTLDASSGHFYIAPPGASGLPASDVQTGSATANGSMYAIGSNYDVHIYWGSVDQGTSLSGWEFQTFVTNVNNATSGVSHPLTQLQANTEYSYLWVASNATEYTAAPASITFRTADETGVYRQKATITTTGYSGSDTLTNIPLLVKLSESNNR